LGDQLPGVFELGAKAMGMTLQEFNKFVASVQLMSDEFLPHFAAELKKYSSPIWRRPLKRRAPNYNG
jgi:hypothetical protein